MSTKTTLKRIALVAVSAMGFGLLSVLPANAVTISGATPPTYDIFAPSVDNNADLTSAKTASQTAAGYTITQDGSTGGFTTLVAKADLGATGTGNLTVTGGTIVLTGSAYVSTSLRSTTGSPVVQGSLTGATISTAGVISNRRLTSAQLAPAVRAVGDFADLDATGRGLSYINTYATGVGPTTDKSAFFDTNPFPGQARLYVDNNTDTDGGVGVAYDDATVFYWIAVGDATYGAAYGANQAGFYAADAFVRIATTSAATITASLTRTTTSAGITTTTPTLESFTIIVSGLATFNGTVTVDRDDTGASGFLGGNNAFYGPASAGVVAGYTTVAAGTVAALHPSWTFTMSGVGAFGVSNCATPQAYLAVPAQTLGGATIALCGDGRAGVGTLTITANGNVVGTQVVNFYGVASKIVATPIYQVARAGNGLIGYETGDNDGINCTTTYVTVPREFPGECADFVDSDVDGDVANPAIAVQVQDALGTPLPITTITMSSSNTAVVSSTPGADGFLDSGKAPTTAGIFLNHFTYLTTPSAKSGDTANLTFSHINSLGTLITSNAVAITVGGTKTGGTVSVKLDKSSYSPGEKMVLTVTGKDSSGNKVFDNATVGDFSSNKSVQGLTGLAGALYYDGAFVYGDDAGEDLFAPAASGAFDIILYSGTATGASVKITATVGDDAATAAANAAADAAAEAIDAANAATDAANLAAEAADAATVAAEEARDAADAATAAVEELATQVAALMAALKAQIATLANTVAKIAKKIKA